MNWRKNLNMPQLVDDEVAIIAKAFNTAHPSEKDAVLAGDLDERQSWAVLQLDLAAIEQEKVTERHTKHAMGCFQAAGDDEPIFTLRAKDAFAPGLILQWCMLVTEAMDMGSMSLEEMAHIDAKLADARHCARAMVEWQRNNTHKIPD